MKMKIMLLAGVAALGMVGCAHDRNRDYVRHDRYPSDEHSTVVIDRDGNRTYVREYETERGPHFQNNMEPRVRGKHADSLGWNTENYYRQRGYY